MHVRIVLGAPNNYILISQLDNAGPPKSWNAGSNPAEDTNHKYSMRLNEITGKPIADVIALFKKEHAEDIELGCERDYCSEPVALLTWFAAKHGHRVQKAHGAFKVDKPLFDKLDFHTAELTQMKAEGLNLNKKSDRIAFAKKHDMIDSLKLIPHHWNTFNGQIIDLTAQAQFVDSGLADDTSDSRYTTDLPKSFF